MTADTALWVPGGPAEQSRVIRKSRFIAHAERVTTRAEAMACVERMRAHYPDARHHCWAYLIGDPEATASASMNDDGEPSGTAGKPILGVIQHKGIGDVMVIVTRYFGGIKLGAGGLVRAYAGATEAVLSQLPLMQHVPHTTCTLHADFSQEQAVRHWCAQNAATITQVDYASDVTLTLAVPDTALEALASLCQARAIRMT